MAQTQPVGEVEQSGCGLEPPTVLKEKRQTGGGDISLGTQTVNQLHRFRIGGEGIAHGVAHFPFARIFVNGFAVPIHTRLQGVAGQLGAEAQTGVEHAGAQPVAGMLPVSSYTKLFLSRSLVEPVLTLDVECFLLLGGVRRQLECQIGVGIEVACQRGSSEEGAEKVFFLTVEIYFEGLGIFQRAKFCFTAFRLKIVLVVRYVTQHIQRPPCVGPPRKIGLIIKEGRVVFSVRVGRSHQVARGFVAQGGHQAHPFVAPAHIGSGSQHGGLRRGFEGFGTLVGDVEHRRHLVAITSLEAAGRKADALHHVGVDDGKSFLLSGTNQHGAVNFYAVEVHTVLVERAAAHVVLRRQLVVRRNACLCRNDFLHAVAGGRGSQFGVGLGDALHRSCLHALSGNNGCSQCATVVEWHYHIQPHRIGRRTQQTAARFVAYHGVDHSHGVGRLAP